MMTSLLFYWLMMVLAADAQDFDFYPLVSFSPVSRLIGFYGFSFPVASVLQALLRDALVGEIIRYGFGP